MQSIRHKHNQEPAIMILFLLQSNSVHAVHKPTVFACSGRYFSFKPAWLPWFNVYAEQLAIDGVK